MFFRGLLFPALIIYHIAVYSQQASAYDEESTNPVIRFTRSLSKLDHVSGLCSEISSARYDTYSHLIRNYLKVIYDGKVPYWVLSDVKERIMDQETCDFMVTESLIHYQFAYNEFVESTKPKILPPVLTENMSKHEFELGDQKTLGVARPTKR